METGWAYLTAWQPRASGQAAVIRISCSTRRPDRARMQAMCNRYVSPDQAAIERFWHIGARNQPRLWATEIFPRANGPFIRAAEQAHGPELVVGQWGLIPFFAKTSKLPYSNNNARSEELTDKPTFRGPWLRGLRCIIPAVSVDEPNWETGKNIWWRFRRADGMPWGLAGLWNTWVDKGTGE